MYANKNAITETEIVVIMFFSPNKSLTPQNSNANSAVIQNLNCILTLLSILRMYSLRRHAGILMDILFILNSQFER